MGTSRCFGSRPILFRATDLTRVASARYGNVVPEIRAPCAERRLALHEFGWQPAMERAGLRRDALYLLRPDGYVALAAPEQSEPALTAYLRMRSVRFSSPDPHDQRKAPQVLRRRRIAELAAPTFPAVVRTVHAAIIRGPQFAAFRSGAEQRRDCAGWLRPAVADAFPAVGSETAIQPAIRAASHVRGVRSGRGLIPRRPPVAPDRSPRCAGSRPRDRRCGRAPRRAGIVALEASIASGRRARPSGSIAGARRARACPPRSTRQRARRQVRPPSDPPTRARRPRSRPSRFGSVGGTRRLRTGGSVRVGDRNHLDDDVDLSTGGRDSTLQQAPAHRHIFASPARPLTPPPTGLVCMAMSRPDTKPISGAPPSSLWRRLGPAMPPP